MNMPRHTMFVPGGICVQSCEISQESHLPDQHLPLDIQSSSCLVLPADESQHPPTSLFQKGLIFWDIQLVLQNI